MPNWPYLAVNFLYQIGLAIWIGGSIALGALVAPALFKALPRQQAGAIFGPTLRRFARLRIGALILIILGAAAKYIGWETHAATPWLAVRWAAIAFLAFAALYEVAYLERALERRRSQLTPDLPEDDPRRRAFNALHHRSEVLMKSSLLAAVVALLFS
jgi:uncharacterized membrane protein